MVLWIGRKRLFIHYQSWDGSDMRSCVFSEIFRNSLLRFWRRRLSCLREVSRVAFFVAFYPQNLLNFLRHGRPKSPLWFLSVRTINPIGFCLQVMRTHHHADTTCVSVPPVIPSRVIDLWIFWRHFFFRGWERFIQTTFPWKNALHDEINED